MDSPVFGKTADELYERLSQEGESSMGTYLGFFNVPFHQSIRRWSTRNGARLRARNAKERGSDNRSLRVSRATRMDLGGGEEDPEAARKWIVFDRICRWSIFLYRSGSGILV